MEEIPNLEELIPPKYSEMKVAPFDSVTVGKYYFVLQRGTFGSLVKITNKTAEEIQYRVKYIYDISRGWLYQGPILNSTANRPDGSYYDITFRYIPVLSSKQALKIGETELNKQRANITQRILSQNNIPAQKNQGPITNILDMADIKSPKSRLGGKIRKTRKGKPKRSKKTQKHKYN